MSRKKKKSNQKYTTQILLIISIICVAAIVLFVMQKKENTKEFAATNVAVTIDLTKPSTVSKFSTGITHTQNDIELNGGAAATSAKQLIQSAMFYQNAFIMGWGADDPEPTQGQYNWGSLDAYVQLMKDTAATPFISFCCSPGWMRPAGFTNDWTYLETAPTQANDGAYAQLAATVATRYPQVKYFQVWNELKGMYGSDPDATPGVGNRWDYERYTKLYNAVWDAVKAVRPDALIGGPYLGTGNLNAADEAVYTYWLKNKHGADFIVLDGGPYPQNGANEFDATYFSAWVNWLRTQPNGGATLPIGWAEWYPRTQNGTTDVNRASAIFVNDMIETLRAGASYGFPWGISGDGQGLTGDPGYPILPITSNGQATPAYAGIKALKDYFGPGTQLYTSSSNPATVTVLASQAKTLLVNQLATSQSVSVNGTMVALAGYQILVIDTPGGGAVITGNPTPSTAITPITTGTGNGSMLSLTICPHGLGNCGDNVSAQGGNTQPKHVQKTVTVTILDSNNQIILTKQGTVTFSSTANNFTGTIALGTIANGNYLVQIKLDGYLPKQAPGIFTIQNSQPVTIPVLSVGTGDIDNNNQIDILDYNLLISCFGSKQTTASCLFPPTSTSLGTDINDDGIVNGTDYNLFLRELSVQKGM